MESLGESLLESQESHGMGPAREKSPGDERSRVGRGGEYVTGQFAGGGCGVVECRSTAG